MRFLYHRGLRIHLVSWQQTEYRNLGVVGWVVAGGAGGKALRLHRPL